ARAARRAGPAARGARVVRWKDLLLRVPVSHHLRAAAPSAARRALARAAARGLPRERDRVLQRVLRVLRAADPGRSTALPVGLSRARERGRGSRRGLTGTTHGAGGAGDDDTCAGAGPSPLTQSPPSARIRFI